MTKDRMEGSTADGGAPVPRSLAAHRLLANKERILTLWEERLRDEVEAAGREPQPILVNTLPVLLSQLAEALHPQHPRRTATDGSSAGHEHGGERVRLTQFRIEDLIAEYRILRQVLVAVLDEETAPLSAEERHTLNSSLDQLLLEACSGYTLVQSRFRDQYFATLAHDLRNPLNAAHLSAVLIARDPRADGVGQWATRIVDNIRRADGMLRDLLDTMQVQTGAQLQLDIVECDVIAVVRQALDRVHSGRGERFVLAAPEPIRGYVAPDPLGRAVENLLTNAVKYGAESRPITVALHQSRGRLILTVHNHGTPIPADKQETLFRAFQRLPDAEASGKDGWGLGLAQVRAVAEAHGGSIGVDSLPERGTTFVIDIPLDARPFQNQRSTPTTDAGQQD